MVYDAGYAPAGHGRAHDTLPTRVAATQRFGKPLEVFYQLRFDDRGVGRSALTFKPRSRGGRRAGNLRTHCRTDHTAFRNRSSGTRLPAVSAATERSPRPYFTSCELAKAETFRPKEVLTRQPHVVY